MPQPPSTWAERLWHLPPGAAVHAAAFDRYLALNLSIVIALGLVAHALLLAGASRRRAPASRRKVLLQALPLGAFAVLLAALAVHADALWRHIGYTGADAEALQVEVVGEQFAWYVRYPGADATFGRTQPALVDAAAGNPLGLDAADAHAADDIVTSQLVVPAGRPIDVRLRALDVIHGFSVPALRLKQDAVPGQTTHLHFTATRPGDYAILCTQVCGSGHYRMDATLRVLSSGDFDRWLAQQQAQQQKTGPQQAAP